MLGNNYVKCPIKAYWGDRGVWINNNILPISESGDSHQALMSAL